MQVSRSKKWASKPLLDAMKYPAFPAAWYLPLQLPLPDTCLLTLRDDPRPEIEQLREVFTAVYASRAKLLGEE